VGGAGVGRKPCPRGLPGSPLSPEEVERIFRHVPGLKYRAALMTCCGAGLRVSETVALKITNIDSARMVTLRREFLLVQQVQFVLPDGFRIQVLRTGIVESGELGHMMDIVFSGWWAPGRVVACPR